jgi:hypothetical protein
VALTLFYRWTQAELLTALRLAQEDYAKGKTIMSSGSGDVNVAKQIQETAKSRILEIQYALYELDPDTYEAFACTGATVTQAVFSAATTDTAA